MEVKMHAHRLGMARTVKISLAFFVFVLAISVAWAQVRNSTNTGTDSTGAVVPNAVATENSLFINRSVKTQPSATGEFPVTLSRDRSQYSAVRHTWILVQPRQRCCG